MTSDPTDTVQSIIDSGRRIRFGKGIVSKTTYLSAGALTAWCIAIWKMSDNMVLNACLFTAAAIASLFVIWFILRTHRYAENNPAQALLEGAELLEWRRMDNAAQGVGALPTTTPVGGLLKGHLDDA